MWFFPDAENSNIAMRETNNNLPRTLAGQDSNNVVPTTLPSGQHLRLQNETDFSRSINAMEISQKDSIPSPYPNSVIASDTDNRHTQYLYKLKIIYWSLLLLIRLQRSPVIAALNSANNVLAILAYSTSAMPYSSRQTTRTRTLLSFLFVFNSVSSL
jgi:hypothetical protein